MGHGLLRLLIMIWIAFSVAVVGVVFIAMAVSEVARLF
jgi:hypothetical protein